MYICVMLETNSSEIDKATQIDQLLFEANFRENGIYAVLNTEGEILISQSPKEAKQDMWSLPQGGLEDGQTPISNAQEEMQQEFGIEPSFMTKFEVDLVEPFEQVYKGLRPLEEAIKNRPTGGKRYRLVKSTYTGPTELCLPCEEGKDPEIAHYKWVSLLEAREILGNNPNKGKDFIKIVDTLQEGSEYQMTDQKYNERSYNSEIQDLPSGLIEFALEQGISPEELQEFGPKKSIKEATIAAFCKGCDNLSQDGVCIHGANDQARYVASGLCGWAVVKGEDVVKKEN